MFENQIKSHQKHYDVSGHVWELYQIIAQCCAIHDIINSCDTNRHYQCIFKTWKNHKGFVNIPKPKENFCISPRLSIFNTYRSFRSIISVKSLMSLIKKLELSLRSICERSWPQFIWVLFTLAPISKKKCANHAPPKNSAQGQIFGTFFFGGLNQNEKLSEINPPLKTLNLSSNALTEINPESLGHIRKLHSIDLSHNLLINIEQGTFFASKKLQVVYLNNNALSDLNPGLFGNHRQLKIVDLSRNQLSTLPEQLFQRTSLQIFRAAHNRLHEIPIKTLNPV